jgi:hypothetical protein
VGRVSAHRGVRDGNRAARELDHVYQDWKSAQDQCRVSIYAGTEASLHLPVVIVTNPNDNQGPSVTNTIEQIAAEILTHYLPQQDGLDHNSSSSSTTPIGSHAAPMPAITIRSSARRWTWSPSSAVAAATAQRLEARHAPVFRHARLAPRRSEVCQQVDWRVAAVASLHLPGRLSELMQVDGSG